MCVCVLHKMWAVETPAIGHLLIHSLTWLALDATATAE